MKTLIVVLVLTAVLLIAKGEDEVPEEAIVEDAADDLTEAEGFEGVAASGAGNNS